jgi:hypothetical protein
MIRCLAGLLILSTAAMSAGALASDLPAEPPVESSAERSIEPSPKPFRWGAVLQAHHYSESLMRIAGPALGLRVEREVVMDERPIRLEAEILKGQGDYSSPVSGEISGVERLASAWHASTQLDMPSWVPRPGFALTTEWTDLRGISSKGQAGYERFNASLWLSGSWQLETEREAGPTQLRAALLLHGWQRSFLSQANNTLGDVTNQQSRGLWIAVERPFLLGGSPSSLRVGWRLYGRSDLRAANSRVSVYEPANRAFEVALTVWRSP